MTAPTVADTEADAAGARQDVERAERDLATGARNVGVSALHKLRDAWRHADLSAQGARERAERDRQAARLKGLAEIGAEVGRLAAGTDLDGLGQALADVATAAGRARAIAAAHDAAVADLIAAAVRSASAAMDQLTASSGRLQAAFESLAARTAGLFPANGGGGLQFANAGQNGGWYPGKQ